ncbi:GNAT family N-acetyltransferase [Pseudogemmobacter faecipullorum]|uniref:GNAT family N-acetyltransferase n=1 Tax=Pseudogemmobacter faecipullorum TaxID=2755041 RepID=A0ABS8CHW9_9RHOB|nr:GNAT family N-acetyltransferase [Pseudogemmobacter faecipullorum]MCB5408997.1 GNAT family N-acetyltransferase [Pseudogemmobacter faecipullorum]
MPEPARSGPETALPGPAASDPAALAHIHAACFTTTPRPWPEAEIAGLLRLPHVFLLSQPAGFLLGQAIAGEAEILTLAVAPEARRQGLARRLVADFLTSARARGAEQAFLEVSAENPAAIALYLATGFTRAGLRRGYYESDSGAKIDALVMSRTLMPGA